MSGHSKWSKIRHSKGSADQQRGKLFSKLARGITVVAKEGGGDPSFNFKLRLAIDRAKAENMPKDAIERAVARGTGEGSDASSFEEVMYEGFAPGGAAVLVACLTDNRNRALGDVRLVFTKRGGNLGNEGSVRWQFEQRGVVRASGAVTDEVELALIDAGAIDIQLEDAAVTIVSSVEDFQRVREAAEAAGLVLGDAGLEWIPKEELVLSDGDREKFETFLGALDDLDDVQDLYTNAA
jgi:YebC/PmpR family DNA-binding regulatory protein